MERPFRVTLIDDCVSARLTVDCDAPFLISGSPGRDGITQIRALFEDFAASLKVCPRAMPDSTLAPVSASIWTRAQAMDLAWFDCYKRPPPG